MWRPFLVVFLSLSAGLCPAQVLWRNTVHGMSVGEAKTTVPDAVSPKDEPSKLGDGALEKLRVPEVRLINQSFIGRLYFRDDELVQVNLEGPRRISPESAASLFDSLAEALRAKYGKESSEKNQRIGSMIVRERTWMSGKTNVTVFLMVIDHDPILNVLYQVRVTEEADKL